MRGPPLAAISATCGVAATRGPRSRFFDLLWQCVAPLPLPLRCSPLPLARPCVARFPLPAGFLFVRLPAHPAWQCGLWLPLRATALNSAASYPLLPPDARDGCLAGPYPAAHPASPVGKSGSLSAPPVCGTPCCLSGAVRSSSQYYQPARPLLYCI